MQKLTFWEISKYLWLTSATGLCYFLIGLLYNYDFGSHFSGVALVLGAILALIHLILSLILNWVAVRIIFLHSNNFVIKLILSFSFSLTLALPIYAFSLPAIWLIGEDWLFISLIWIGFISILTIDLLSFPRGQAFRYERISFWRFCGLFLVMFFSSVFFMGSVFLAAWI